MLHLLNDTFPMDRLISPPSFIHVMFGSGFPIDWCKFFCCCFSLSIFLYCLAVVDAEQYLQPHIVVWQSCPMALARYVITHLGSWNMEFARQSHHHRRWPSPHPNSPPAHCHGSSLDFFGLLSRPSKRVRKMSLRYQILCVYVICMFILVRSSTLGHKCCTTKWAIYRFLVTCI